MLRFKKDSLLRELEVLNSEEFECSRVTFFCGFAFSIFMLENASSRALLFLEHVQEYLNQLKLPYNICDYQPSLLFISNISFA